MGFLDKVRGWINGRDNWAPQAPMSCCREPENLLMVEKQPHVRVYRCQVCTRRHFRAFMSENRAAHEPGKVTIN